MNCYNNLPLLLITPEPATFPGNAVKIIKGFQPLTIITKRSILDVAAVLYQPLTVVDDFLTKIQWQKNQTIFLDHEIKQIWF